MSILIILAILCVSAAADAYCVNYGWLGCIDENRSCSNGGGECKKYKYNHNNVCVCLISI